MHEITTFGETHAGRAFVKMHGLLNHFVIVDARLDAFRPTFAQVSRICDLRSGIGADQLIVIEPPTESGKKGGADVFMRILNVDGREVEACGNATRCVAWLLLEEASCDVIHIETLAGVIGCKRMGVKLVSCSMGEITMDWRKIPLAEERDTCHLDLAAGPLRDAVALNIGNPHIVYFVDDLDSVDIEALAPGLQENALFPDQVNVGIAQMVSSDEMRLVVYERGAGLTTACGSGACVAAYAAMIRGLTSERRIRVIMPAGSVEIEMSDDGIATMTGPVEYCFSGLLS